MAAIELQGVTKKFGDVIALRGVDLRVEEGEIYGFLGPNGAGKSTTIKILLDFVEPTSGTASVFGKNTQVKSLAVRKQLGVLPEGFEPYPRLSGSEHVSFTLESKSAYCDPDEILERVGLDHAADRKAGTYSTGMKQRLGLGMALVGEPDLLILDEPTNGLDPNGARRMREIIMAEHERGATVMFSSHILSQVEAVCDRVGILRDGELVASDDIESLQASVRSEEIIRIDAPDATDETVELVESLDGVNGAELEGGVLMANYTEAEKLTILNAIEDSGVSVENFSLDEPSLEQLFEVYTSREVST